MAENNYFMCGIGALIWTPGTQKYLMLRRASQRDYGAGIWECVTGRVDQGESFEMALHREVAEELSAQVKIDFLLGTTHLYRGAPTPQNELLGVVYACSLADPETIQPSAEHDAFRWAEAAAAIAWLDQVQPQRPWFREAIQRAEEMRRLIPAELAAYYRKYGFETK